MSTEQTKQRFLIVDKHLKNPTLSNRKLAKSLKISRRTVDTVLKWFTEQKTIQRKQGSGQKNAQQILELSNGWRLHWKNILIGLIDIEQKN